jgi:hypothetical protein
MDCVWKEHVELQNKALRSRCPFSILSFTISWLSSESTETEEEESIIN